MQERILGPNHRLTLRTAGNLAITLRKQGKVKAAETL